MVTMLHELKQQELMASFMDETVDEDLDLTGEEE
jgi:hypothetical protein